MNTKKCNCCHKTKPTSEFYRNKRMKDGYQRSCIECGKARNKEWYSHNKECVAERHILNRTKSAERFKMYKSTLSCIKCGENEACCLEFHHINPDNKAFNISEKVRSLKWKTLLEEIEKCVVLCSNCHKKVHNNILAL